MKNSLKIHKNIWYTSIMILILVFVSTFVAIVSPAQAAKSVSETAISNYLAAQANPALTDQQKIKTAIDAYFTMRYEGQKTLDAKDYSVFVSPKTGSQEWLRKERDKQEIEIFQGTTFGLNYLSYKYTLSYQDIKINGNAATITLFENNEVVYAVSAPTVTKLANLEHILSLEFDANNWKIVSDIYRDELNQLMRNKNKLEIKQDIQNEYNANKLKTSHPAKAGLARTFLPAYNRTNAVNYAHTWWNYPGNSSDFRPFYTTLGAGGDCTNFASQVIKAGGGKLDSSGTKKWFYSEGAVGDNFNVWSTYGDDLWSDYTWAYIGNDLHPNLYDYLIDNTSDTPGPSGLVWPLTSLCSMSGGDLIQLSSNGGSSYFHVVVVVGVGAGCTADGHNVYVNAHDVDRQNYPVIAYTGYTKRLLKISQP